MNQHLHARIAYIACRLITGKRAAALYNHTASREVDMADLPDAAFLKEFDEKLRDYVPGFASNCTYRYEPGSDPAIEIFLNERTFIIHVNGSDAYFIGNIQRDMVYLYDHRESAHFRYRVIAYVEDQEKAAKGVAGQD